MSLLAVGHKRTGACPTFDRAVLQRDGYLLRIALVGGSLTPPQAAAVADVAATLGNGMVELTNRGNLQVRGLRSETLDPVRASLRDLGLGDPGAALVTISPFAGPAERALRTRLVAVLEEALADGRPLSPKFVVHIDDVDRTTSRRRAEATLRVTDGFCRVEISPLGQGTTTIDGAVRAVRALVDACRSVPDDARVADVLDARGPAWLHAVLPVDLDGRPAPAGTAVAPLVAGSFVSSRGQTVLVAEARFGRIDAPALAELAGLGLDVRVTPWRSFAVSCSNDPRVRSALLDQLERIGLIVDPADPAAGIITCIGAAGCWQTEADTLVEAERVVARRSAAGTFDRGVTHITGCDKRCATRDRVAVTLLGRADGSAFETVISA